MGKKILSILIVMTVIAGCSQNTDKEGTAGDAISTLNQILDKTEEQLKAEKNQKDNDKEDSEEKKVDKEETPTADAKSNDAGSDDEASNSNVNPPSKSTGNKKAGSSNNKTDQSSNSTVPETPKPSKPQEPAQPSKPAEPTLPSKPVCDDTLPAGAYPIEKEDEVCTQIEKDMIQNAIDGKPTFNQYEIEYGATECGTKYFYIIPIY